MATKHSKLKTKEKAKHHHAKGHKAETQSAGSESVELENSQFTASAERESVEEQTHFVLEDETENPVKLDFPYSELVRAYAPKAMDVADKVATDWKKDGSFMNLGIDNAYANMAVSLGLKKAKEIEKKLDEKGVLSAVRMGVEVLKQKVNKKS